MSAQRSGAPGQPIPRAARLGAALATALLAAACAVGPNYHRPAAPVPSAYKELPPGWKWGSPQDAQRRGDWWAIFEDPELDRLEHEVRISNQNVQQYEAQYRQAVALLREAQAQLFPTVTGNFSAQRGGGGGGTAAVSSAVGSGAGGSTHTEFTLEGVLSWQPDIWGSIRRQVESRKAGVQVSEANLANAELSAQATLAADYFDLRAADSLRALLTRAVALINARSTSRRTNKVRHRDQRRCGRREASLESTQAQLVAVEQQRGTYEHAIAVLIGHLPSELSVGEAPLAPTVPPGSRIRAVGASRAQSGIAAAERQMQRRTRSSVSRSAPTFRRSACRRSAAIRGIRCRP